MSCKKCKKTEKECSKNLLNNENIICNKCNVCKLCSKQILCLDCCDICERCDKYLLKNNFPNEMIINGKCDKCRHLCYDCEKYIGDHKSIYYNNCRYCDKCIEKFNVNNEKPIIKVINDVRKLIGWKEKKIKKKDKKQEIKDELPENPSNDKIKYTLRIIINKNKKIYKWELLEKKKLCITCCCSIWIKSNNIQKTNIYYCSNCKPESENQKYKYDKDKQKWTMYSQKIECNKCKIEKWTKDITQKVCIKCINLETKS